MKFSPFPKTPHEELFLDFWEKGVISSVLSVTMRQLCFPSAKPLFMRPGREVSVNLQTYLHLPAYLMRTKAQENAPTRTNKLLRGPSVGLPRGFFPFSRCFSFVRWREKPKT